MPSHVTYVLCIVKCYSVKCRLPNFVAFSFTQSHTAHTHKRAHTQIPYGRTTVVKHDVRLSVWRTAFGVAFTFTLTRFRSLHFASNRGQRFIEIVIDWNMFAELVGSIFFLNKFGGFQCAISHWRHYQGPSMRCRWAHAQIGVRLRWQQRQQLIVPFDDGWQPTSMRLGLFARPFMCVRVSVCLSVGDDQTSKCARKSHIRFSFLTFIVSVHLYIARVLIVCTYFTFCAPNN